MILKMFKVRTGEDPGANRLLRELRSRYPNLEAVKVERVLRIEGIDPADLHRFQPIFAHPVVEQVGRQSLLDTGQGPIAEVSYKRAVTDPELTSIRRAASNMKVKGLKWARLSTRYQFVGLSDAQAQEATSRHLCNAQVQTLVTEEWPTLIPQGAGGPIEQIDVAHMSLQELLAMSDERRILMPTEQLLAMQRFYLALGRPAYDAEIEYIAAAWSDHCSHTTWKTLGLLQYLQAATARINHPLVVSAYVDNSGVVQFYDGWCINLKGETHISPTFGGDPKGGIETKHGGVIRDVFFTGLGAWPIAGSTVLATCEPRIPWELVPAGAFHPQVVLKQAIAGTADYCNPMGIPMAFWQYLVHAQNWKGFALGHSVGILPESAAQKGEPRPGDFVILIGGDTGLDGLHGATVSSGATTSETAKRDAAHVQIGMPIEERKMMEVIPVLRDHGCIRAGTDCGAAGLASAFGELASQTGGWINLAWVKLKCVGMRVFEILLSESQERGIVVVPREKRREAEELLEVYGVPFSVIGVFTDSKRCQVVYAPSMDQAEFLESPVPSMSEGVAVDLPYDFLNGDCPLPKIRVGEPPAKRAKFEPQAPTSEAEWVKLASSVLAHYNIADQSAAGRQYDQTVQGNTVLTFVSGREERMPDELFVTAPLRGKPYGVGIANSVNQFYGEIDPATFGRLMLASAAAKLVAAGFSPDDIGGFCANVYTPPVLKDPRHAWALEQLVRYGYAPGSEEIGIPVVSGKDSSSGRFTIKATGKNIDAPLTLDILAVGRMRDAGNIIRKPFRRPGDLILWYAPGLVRAELGGSILADLQGARGDTLCQIDLREMRKGFANYHELTKHVSTDGERLIRSRSGVAEGGLFRRLFECSFGPNLGCVTYVPDVADPLWWLFAETHGVIMFTVPEKEWDPELLPDALVAGRVTAEPSIRVERNGNALFTAGIDELARGWSTTFSEVAL